MFCRILWNSIEFSVRMCFKQLCLCAFERSQPYLQAATNLLRWGWVVTEQWSFNDHQHHAWFAVCTPSTLSANFWCLTTKSTWPTFRKAFTQWKQLILDVCNQPWAHWLALARLIVVAAGQPLWAIFTSFLMCSTLTVRHGIWWDQGDPKFVPSQNIDQKVS